MKKIIKTMLNIAVISLLIIASVSVCSSSSFSYINKDLQKENINMNHQILNIDNFSFHGNTSYENGNWFIVKFYSNETIFIDEVEIYLSYSNDNGTRWGHYTSNVFFTDLNITKYDPFAYMRKISHPNDRYLQVNTGSINYTYNHLTNKPGYNRTEHIRITKATLTTGTWYLVSLVAPTKTCNIKVWINNTNAIEFNATEGSSCFLYENEDFNSKINLKTIPVSCILEGMKNIKINDYFIGYFYTFLENGYAIVNYTSPEGLSKESRVSYFRQSLNVFDGSEFNPLFDVISGTDGIWKFEVNMAGVFLSTVNIFGADVKLPK